MVNALLPLLLPSAYNDIHNLAGHDDNLAHRLAFEPLGGGRVGHRSGLNIGVGSPGGNGDVEPRFTIERYTHRDRILLQILFVVFGP